MSGLWVGCLQEQLHKKLTNRLYLPYQVLQVILRNKVLRITVYQLTQIEDNCSNPELTGNQAGTFVFTDTLSCFLIVCE